MMLLLHLQLQAGRDTDHQDTRQTSRAGGTRTICQLRGQPMEGPEGAHNQANRATGDGRCPVRTEPKPPSSGSRALAQDPAHLRLHKTLGKAPTRNQSGQSQRWLGFPIIPPATPFPNNSTPSLRGNLQKRRRLTTCPAIGHPLQQNPKRSPNFDILIGFHFCFFVRVNITSRFQKPG